MRNNAADGLICGEGKVTRFKRATMVWLYAKPESRRLSRGNTRVGPYGSYWLGTTGVRSDGVHDDDDDDSHSSYARKTTA